MAKQSMVGYHLDLENHWVAELACGHFQHVRHDPPITTRPWVLTPEGRNSMLGYELNCKKCPKGLTSCRDRNEPQDKK